MAEPDEEAARRFDETVRRMLHTPPKPHEAMKLGRPRRKGDQDKTKGEPVSPVRAAKQTV